MTSQFNRSTAYAFMIHAAIRWGVFSSRFLVKNSSFFFTSFLVTRKLSQVFMRLDGNSKSQWDTPTTAMHAHRVEGLKWGTSHLTVGSLGLLPPLLPLTLLQQWPRCLRYGRGPPSLCWCPLAQGSLFPLQYHLQLQIHVFHCQGPSSSQPTWGAGHQ